ncbi:MAG: hypothetical protein ACJ74H_01670 [Thermoanaerobaculia bacterium]
MSKHSRIVFIVVAWMAIFPPAAQAYLDPGTGSLIVQSVIAAIAAVGFGLRHYWGRIRAWVHKPRGHQNSSESSSNDPE